MSLFKRIRFFCGFLVLSILISCSKDSASSEDIIVDPDPPIEEVFNYTSDAKYNLNIVYFIPKDVPNRTNSHKRVSEILLNGQEFYKQNMNGYGFGDKTYNLLVDNAKNRVKINYVEGKFNTSNYPYEGGGNKVIEEIEAYFKVNPSEKNSEHTLVLMPVKDHDNPNVPFYGLGRWCFALDYNDMDVKHFGGNSKLSNDATKYIGGLLHELGHGLNLPHNKQKVSEYTDANKGTSLMGAGNYTYGSTPTFLTEASCAILNNNQIFNNSNAAFYTGATAQINTIQANFEDGALKVSGTFQSDVAVNYIGFYNDPADDNADYDAVTWATAVDDNSTFSVSMPINELDKKGTIEYVLRLRLCHTNGEISNFSYSYKFENNIPIIEFGDQDYLVRTNWSIVSFTSEEYNATASMILDDDPSTFWHSCWTGGCTATYPHSIVVDTGETITAKGFSFLQRNGMRKIKDVEILVSADNVTWESKGNYVLKDINTIHHVHLDSETTFRYFKIVAKSAFDGAQFAAMAEIKCF
ncbi:discoidin domain-containing protein [uncultured Wocania sp.]|uniref:discoidin domain-containing protein n=1 Tax=uncultured Wocania sp. TaxID=2834404 RepID=UPI0030FC57B8